jgi:UDP-N-acetylmuramyl pentapeptide phosphotransferase/UDP-N-acetylglucosamine-1-phosphate transferase
MTLLNLNLYLVIKILFLIIFFIIFNKICLNNKLFLSDNNISDHKIFISNESIIPISGGFFLLISNIFLQEKFFFNFYNYFYLGIFFIGLYADLSKNFKPILRIVAQVLIVGTLIYFFNIFIRDLRVPFFNSLLSYDVLSLLFTVFCIIVFINGANLIDGINLSAIGYFLLIFITIFTLSINNNFYLENEFIKMQIFLLTIVLLFNFFNKSFLGDSGVYLLSLVTSIVIIKFINKNNSISPYFAVLLLWYPCFENLFSIIRRLLTGSSTSTPDNRHLHHFIYSFLKQKNIRLSNNVAGLVILSFNTIIFFFGYKYYNKPQLLIIIIFLAISLYLISYHTLKKKLKTNF